MALLSALSRTGSVTAAAASVGMSQPAASAMLKQLETRLGFDLFTRARRRLSLTVNGRALLPEIENALGALDSVERLADGMRLGKARRLVIGAVPAVGASILPEAMQQLRDEQPELSVVVRAGTAVDVINMAAEQRIDLGVILGPASNEYVGVRHLANLKLCCAMPRGHRLACSEGISIETLAGEKYIGHSRHLPVGALTAQHLEAAGFEFAPAVEITQFSAACAFAESGAGVAVVDGLSAIYAQRRGLAVPPLLIDGELSLNLVWPLSLGLGSVAKRLADRLAADVERLTSTSAPSRGSRRASSTV